MLFKLLLLPYKHFRPLFLLALVVITFQTISKFLSIESQRMLSEAYIGVSVFVIITLLIATKIESLFNLRYVKKNTFQGTFKSVVFAALLGAMPGCGGAIMIVSYYMQGKVSFGSVVAALSSTMGDAAFLLIAMKPLVGLSVILISITTGIITGLIIDLVQGSRYIEKVNLEGIVCENSALKSLFTVRTIWWIVFGLGIVVGFFRILYTNNIVEGSFLDEAILKVGTLGALLSVFLWAFDDSEIMFKTTDVSKWDLFLHKIEVESNFIIVWVIVSYFIYFALEQVFGLDVIRILINSTKYALPTVAILIGFIPGCGPQILLTTLYVTGIIPFSSQLGNAISTDGDALFPALALAPRDALLATAYSAIPAFILSYAWLFLIE